MALLTQRPTKEVRSATRFHADELYLQVRGEVQQLDTRKQFRTTTSPRSFIPTMWNVVFPKSIPSVNSSMAFLLRTPLIPQLPAVA